MPIRILFITGNSRSGSTVLGTALNQVNGVFCAGEMQRIWDKGWLTDECCSCGAPILSCSFWSPVFGQIIGSYDAKLAKELRQARDSFVKLRGLPRLLTSRSLDSLPANVRNYLDVTERLYRAIQEHAGCRLIVDTSKYPTYSYLLRLLPALDIRVVHLVRDARATAYSWQRVKAYPTAKGTQYMERHTALRSAAAWLILNSLADLLWERDPVRYMLIRYEDFVNQPRRTFRRILNHAGEPEAALPLIGEDAIDIRHHHIIAGNANRFRTGLVKLMLDDEWRHKLNPLDAVVVTLVTFPLLRKYGYWSQALKPATAPLPATPHRLINTDDWNQ
jgi:hypothetical protein